MKISLCAPRMLLCVVATLACCAFVLAWPAVAAGAVVDAVFSRTDGHDAVFLDQATVVVDESDYTVVKIAAGLFADDVQRVLGQRPHVAARPPRAGQAIIVGTLGHSGLIDRLVAEGKLNDVEKVRGVWEGTLWQIVEKPVEGVDRALVIVGSDRRGAAYGLTVLSEKIGVSPWYWWADLPAQKSAVIGLRVESPVFDAPAVKYRGIFINDEDWGLFEWASKTFDPALGNIGPKTYEKVYELMLRLRLNYLWPAMHACTEEFGLVAGNAELADKWGIVGGSSHCEPMLCNNIHWNTPKQGPWNYSLNGETLHAYWEETAVQRGYGEAVWTLGIRGIHDQGMEEPPTQLNERIQLVDRVIADQRALLEKHVSKQWGPVAQCFVPYKEVLPLYDAGLKIPEDVTLVWVDDNFGYTRRLSTPDQRGRSGGAGVYWHLSYYGGPHSYLWINTTPPGLMWEQLHKAWENEARTLWIINVGDIKPMEIGIDFFSRFAWAPDNFGSKSPQFFIQSFATRCFGEKTAEAMSGLLAEYYRLGTIHKPELMTRTWVLSLSEGRAAELEKRYRRLLEIEQSVAACVPADKCDAYTEMVGFPARVLANSGLIFMLDRKALTTDSAVGVGEEIAQARARIDADVDAFNNHVAGGKWRHMMPGAVTAETLSAWNSQVRWPWGEKAPAKHELPPKEDGPVSEDAWREAAAADHQTGAAKARWTVISGLGATGTAIAVKPASLASAWKENDASAPTLEYSFEFNGGEAAFVDFLPMFRIYPGLKLRVAVLWDDGEPVLVEVPGSGGSEDEGGRIRQKAVQDNFVRVRIPAPKLSPGKHTLKIRAVDPGIVIDRVALP